ncbi:TadE/TadG family type IV pilus assembly protein [Qipengyuania sp.]|uniref:TadE/TadG family type IV pilus assembly protein n=1 Tax=Qipengyuania sp. TaxID=2004515 RepID=UPI0035C8441E
MRAIASDQRGAAIMEFGLVVSVFMMMMMGMFDLGQRMYLLSVLRGAAEDAARKSSLGGATPSTLDAEVLSTVRNVAPGATINTTRQSYFDFADIDRSEQWNDVDSSGACDNGEAYVDENGNGQWDADIGVSGNGGAGDVVLYTVSITYDPLFPIPFIDSSAGSRTLSASTVKKNQPFASQTSYGSVARSCT